MTKPRPKMPCVKDCADRTRTCHDTCEKYLEWKKYRREERYALVAEDDMRRTVEGLHAVGVKRTKQGRGRHRNG